MKRWQVIWAGVVAAVVAQGAGAVFRAADLVVVPIAAATAGLASSNWKTDVEIRNVDEVPIDVEIVLLPSSGASNSNWYANFENHLGGRSEDGFQKVDERLKDIQPGAVVVIEDIVKETWGEFYKGALLVWAFEAGTFSTTDPPGGVPRKIVVTSRTYTLSEQEPEEEGGTAIPLTQGQAVPGLPWYYYLDPSQADKGLNRVTFTGITEDADFRTNIGFLNFSDPLTTVEIEVILRDEEGEVVKDIGTVLTYLAHRQWDQAVRNLFQLSEEDYPTVKNATVEVIVKGWLSSAQDPVPGLMVYVSRVDNHTNDAVYLEQAFAAELPWDCVFNGNCGAGATATGAGPARRRPLPPPTP